MPNPSAFGRYHAQCKATGRQEHRKLNVFAAHYRLASSAHVTTLSGLSDRSIDAYNSCFRVAMAWTALESLESAVSSRGSVGLTMPDLAQRFRSQVGAPVLQALIASRAVHAKEKRLLRILEAGESDDVRALAYGIRNSLLHGDLTASAAKLTDSKKRRALVFDLASDVLDAVNRRFTKYVQGMR